MKDEKYLAIQTCLQALLHSLGPGRCIHLEMMLFFGATSIVIMISCDVNGVAFIV